MASPFPGMDPYLECHWRDIHASLTIYARDQLQGILPKGLRARVEERVVLETPQGIGEHPLFPDVRVLQYGPRGGKKGRPQAAVALAEPVLVPSEFESPTETYIEIIDSESGNHVVTVIEFLSPSNKSHGANREHYLKKQREICASTSNLVEVDLNRYGTHTLAFPLSHLKPPYRTPYMACIRRATRRSFAEVYPMPIWERLPAIKIPLRPDDTDVALDLQDLIEQCYRNGAYEGTLDYTTEPEPPLLGADKDWTDQWLRRQGLRSRRGPARRKKQPRGHHRK